MPYRDRAKHAETQLRWRQSRTPEYHKWLYQRRKLRFWIAESGRALLEEIAGERRGMYRKAQEWIVEVERREREVGFVFDHERNVPSNVISRPPPPQ